MAKKRVLGLDKLQKSFKTYEKQIDSKADAVVLAGAMFMATTAKQIAMSKGVHDNGTLIQGIDFRKIAYKRYVVFSSEFYSAYHEFGTGGEVNIPRGWEDVARQFKGKGIKRINLAPRPFFYPAYKEAKKQVLKDLRKIN